jgi:hypothetical protein
MSIPREYLTVAEAAEFCGVSLSQFRAKAPVMGLRPFQFMGKLLYRVADLRMVLDSAWRQSICYYIHDAPKESAAP